MEISRVTNPIALLGDIRSRNSPPHVLVSRQKCGMKHNLPVIGDNVCDMLDQAYL